MGDGFEMGEGGGGGGWYPFTDYDWFLYEMQHWAEKG